MTPYYQDDAVTIYHGDCREVLPSLSFGVVVTDPPYGTNHYVPDTAALNDVFVSLLARPAAVFGWPELLVKWCVGVGMAPDEWVTWWPTNGAIRGFNLHGLWRESECIAVFGQFEWENLRTARSENVGLHYVGEGRLDSHGDPRSRRMGDVWRHVAPGLAFNSHQRLHPNEKPVDLLRTLLGAAPPGVIIDPFMGSGPTVRAAKDLNRKAIGIELDERYCEIAARRCAQEVLAL